VAKKVFSHEVTPVYDGKGNVVSYSPRVVEQKGLTRAQKKSLELIPFTEGPGTSKWKRFKRNLM
jgi:hypothetical protein